MIPLVKRCRQGVAVFLGHPVTRNACALYGAQAARLIAPLVLIPYLARVLRPRVYGQLAFAQALGLMLAIVVEFGFTYSATREIARHRHSKPDLDQIAAAVLGAKIPLIAVVAVMGAIVWRVVPFFHADPGFVIGACLFGMALSLSPSWYFQGIESMAGQSAVDIAGFTGGTLAVLFIVRSPAQAVWALYLPAAGALLGAVVNYVRMYQCVRFVLPQWRAATRALRDGLAFFIMRASTSLYTQMNVFLLGLFVPAAGVADFASADKVARASLVALFPGLQATFPRLSHLFAHDRERGMRVALLMLGAFTGLAALGAFVLAEAAPWVVSVVLGPGYGPAVGLLRWLAVLLPVITANSVLGTQFLIPLGLDWFVSKTVVATGATNVVAVLLLAPHFGARGVAWCAIGSELLLTASSGIMALISRKRLAAVPTRQAQAAGSKG